MRPCPICGREGKLVELTENAGSIMRADECCVPCLVEAAAGDPEIAAEWQPSGAQPTADEADY